AATAGAALPPTARPDVPRPAALPPRAAPSPAAPPPAAGADGPSGRTPLPASGDAPAGAGGVPAPVDVRAERVGDDSSVTVTWTAGGPGEVEYKVSRLTPEGRWHVVGRTRTTAMIDGAVPEGTDVPVYGVVARLDGQASEQARSTAPAPAPAPGTAPATAPPAAPEPVTPPPSTPPPSTPPPSTPRPSTPRPGTPPASTPPPDPAPGGIPAVRELTVAAPGTLVFDWPAGVTEAMVVVRRDRPPVAPDDPEATSWKITNMRYQLDGGLLLPPSVAPPCHVAVASCRRERGELVVAPAFGPTARTSVPA
ncbi:MAG: hypothetical protein NTW05_18940, partial [Pseudonocardiales bacterium]|nr:hypothetical protein [Pseudonocardiales bacterium]